MKTKAFLFVCLFTGIGLTQLSAQPELGKSGNVIYYGTFDTYGFKVPLNCNYNTLDFLAGTVRFHTVVHYSNFDGNLDNFVWCRQEFHGEVVSQATKEIFKVNDVFTQIGPYTQPGTGHLNVIGNQGSHYILNYLWDNWADPNDITIVSVKCPGGN